MAPSENIFGGFWTQQKITIFKKYLFAYLQIMSKQRFELLYFDGFAGSGEIESTEGDMNSVTDGVAIQVLSLDHAKNFDLYYLVELDKNKCKRLEETVKQKFPHKNVRIIAADCNAELVRIADYMRKNKYSRALIFIDPFGMSLDWQSIEACKGLGIDIWILIPTGAVNRMLTTSGQIEDSWLKKLSRFLGIPDSEIKRTFYTERTEQTLFGPEQVIEKESKSAEKIADLYSNRLKNVWTEVSKPFPMRNSRNSIIFHFIMASNNKYGKKIANDIIGKELGV